MNLLLQQSKIISGKSIVVSGSKSETNRLLILQALYPNISIKNTSNSDDSEVMLKALKTLVLNEVEKLIIIDVHHAGTAMRFLTAFFAIQEDKQVLLTGSIRMKERPIKILVDALRQLGANIQYTENEGYPPLMIKGKRLTENKVSLSADTSSQYISALLLIASKLKNGLELTLEGEITSIPYINMTLALLHEIGIETLFEGNKIKVSPVDQVKSSTLTVESDWSSASYWYSIVALSEIGTEVILSSYKKNSLQGDVILVEIYKELGVETIFSIDDSKVTIKKQTHSLKNIKHNLNKCPDIAQTIAVTCFGLGINCELTGLHTLKIKETDRLEALKIELTKLGANVSVTNETLNLKPSDLIKENITIATYQDHRMAMAFAPLALKANLIIEEAEVVSKSYPNFWNDLQYVGFKMEVV